MASRRRERLSRGRLVALEGASGVGKSTTALALARALSADRVPEAVERLRPAPSLRFRGPAGLVELETTLLREEARRFHEARRLRDRGATVVLDTGFLGPITYSAGLARSDPALRPAVRILRDRVIGLIRAGRLGLPDVTVYLDLSAAAIAQRGRRDPRGHPAGSARLHARVGAWERRLWKERFRRLSPERLFVVRAVGPTDEVVDRIVARLGGPRPRTPPTASAAVRAVRAFARGTPGRTHREDPRGPRRRRPGPPTGSSGEVARRPSGQALRTASGLALAPYDLAPRSPGTFVRSPDLPSPDPRLGRLGRTR